MITDVMPHAFSVTTTAAPNVQYEVRIQAVGTLGGGDFSNATVFRTNEFGKTSLDHLMHLVINMFYISP